MKAYLLLTGSLFGLAGVAHLVRVFVEGGHSFSGDPQFFVTNIGLFVVGGGMALWALQLARHQGLGLTKVGAGRER
jgi:hypothetical protein